MNTRVETIHLGGIRTSLGWLSFATGERGLLAAAFEDAEPFERRIASRRPDALLARDPRQVAEMARQLGELAEARREGLDAPLDAHGSAFQERVWAALRAIPPGRTIHYGALAASLGAPKAARAVARACAANPVALAIPCHRVTPATGGVGGYRWGSERKATLLAREGAAFAGGSLGDQSAALAQR